MKATEYFLYFLSFGASVAGFGLAVGPHVDSQARSFSPLTIAFFFIGSVLFALTARGIRKAKIWALYIGLLLLIFLIGVSAYNLAINSKENLTIRAIFLATLILTGAGLWKAKLAGLFR